MCRLSTFTAVVVVVAACGAGLYLMFTAPLYDPSKGGLLAKDIGGVLPEGLTPPASFSSHEAECEEGALDWEEGWWRVSEVMHLYHRRLCRKSAGNGERKVLLIVHGGPGAPSPDSTWKSFKTLPDEYEVYAYHARGCGQSVRPVIDLPPYPGFRGAIQELVPVLGLGSSVADIERIRRGLGVEQLSIVGHSWGGFVASLYAVEFPSRVRALVLVSPAAMLRFPPPPELDMLGIMRGSLPEEDVPAFDEFVREFTDYSALFARERVTDEEVATTQWEFNAWFIKAMQALDRPLPPAIMRLSSYGKPDDLGGFISLASYLSLGLRFDARAALRHISAPVLLLHGDEDLMPFAAVHEYATSIATGRAGKEACVVGSESELREGVGACASRVHVLRLAGVGHFSPVETPQVFGKVLEVFLG